MSRAYRLPSAFALAERGMCAAHIARELGVSCSAITGWARRNAIDLHDGRAMGVPAHGVKQRAEKMAGMFRQGLTLEQIGQTFDITRERVRQILRKIGVAPEEGGYHVTAVAKQRTRENRQLANSLNRWGMTPGEMRALRTAGVPKYFHSQRTSAAQRGIEWSLTLAQWWDLWQTSGKWGQRGRGKGKYLMSRIKDAGGYEVGNVHIQLATENSLEAVKQWRGKVKANRGVYRMYPGTSRPYIARIGRKQLARCATEEEAAQVRMAFIEANGYVLRDNGTAHLRSAQREAA